MCTALVVTLVLEARNFAEKSPSDLHTFHHKSNMGFALAYQYNMD